MNRYIVIFTVIMVMYLPPNFIELRQAPSLTIPSNRPMYRRPFLQPNCSTQTKSRRTLTNTRSQRLWYHWSHISSLLYCFGLRTRSAIGADMWSLCGCEIEERQFTKLRFYGKGGKQSVTDEKSDNANSVPALAESTARRN